MPNPPKRVSDNQATDRDDQRCALALAGDQVGQGSAVGCEAGKLCKRADTVLKAKRGARASCFTAGRNTETYGVAMTALVR